MSDYIRQNFDYKNNNVYCVRYLVDTIMSHRALGLNIEPDYDKYNILKPDLIICVRLDEKIRQKRITERGKSILDKTLDDNIFRTKFLHEFKRYSSEFVFFNNDEEDIESKTLTFFDKYIKGGSN